MASDEWRLIAVVKIEGEVQSVTFDYKLEFYSRVNGYIKQGKSTAYWVFTSRRTLINNSRRCLPCCLSVWIYLQVFRGRRFAHATFFSLFSRRSKVSRIKQICSSPSPSPPSSLPLRLSLAPLLFRGTRIVTSSFDSILLSPFLYSGFILCRRCVSLLSHFYHWLVLSLTISRHQALH